MIRQDLDDLLEGMNRAVEADTPPWDTIADINSTEEEQEYGVVLNSIFMTPED